MEWGMIKHRQLISLMAHEAMSLAAAG